MFPLLSAVLLCPQVAEREWKRSFVVEGWKTSETVKEGDGVGLRFIPTPRWTNQCHLTVTSRGENLTVRLDFPLKGGPSTKDQIVFGMFDESQSFHRERYRIVVFNWAGIDLPVAPPVRVGQAALLLPGPDPESGSNGKNIAVSRTKATVKGNDVFFTLRHERLAGYKPEYAYVYWLPPGRTPGPNVLSHEAAMFDFAERTGSVFLFFPQLWPIDP